ncbi:UNVERIFIED_CONTAM: hypothetical protein FKN15_063050 [Acipenser sinensis]
MPRCFAPSVLRCSLHRCLGASAPSVPERLGASRLQCSDAPCNDALGALGASTPQSLVPSVPSVSRCFGALGATEPRCLDAPYIGAFSALGASVPSVPQSFDSSVLRTFGTQTFPALMPSVPLVLQCLKASSLCVSLLRCPRCLDTPCIGALGASAPFLPQSLDALVLRAFGAQMLPASVPSVHRCLGASAPSVSQSLDASVLRTFGAQMLTA